MVTDKSNPHLRQFIVIFGQNGPVITCGQFVAGLVLWAALGGGVGCSTSQPEPGHYLPDSSSSFESTDESTDTEKETDLASDSVTTVDCNDINPCSEHGRCIEKDGNASCLCDDGWTGTSCDDCAPGWHEFGDDCRLDEQCLSTSCAFHEVKGGCDVEDGRVVCDCEGKWDEDNHCATCLPGYHEEDDKCVEDQYCVSGGPCENGGICSEQSGRIVCDCSTAGNSRVDGEHWTGEYCDICPVGFHVVGQDCIPNEKCTTNACGDNGTCVVAASGSAICICDQGWTQKDTSAEFSPCTECAQGYHHPDGDDTVCAEDEVCKPLSCGVGTCSENDEGGIDCKCPQDTVLDPDFNCSKCLPTYHWVIGTGCVENDADCDASDPCGDFGVCVYANGVKSCDCDPMYTGTYCDRCIDGYQDNDNNGVCAPDCETAEDNGVNCGSNGSCSDASGVAICDCSGQWSGAACDVCPDGNHMDGGDCVINEACEPDSCNGHGACTVPASTGVVACACDDLWMDDFYGNPCAVCVAGYQNKYTEDDCQPSCATAVTAGLDCGDNGACELNAVTGAPHCACDMGYAGEDCSLCAAGFHLEGVMCIANDSSCEVSDPCGEHGVCSYSGGVKSCVCDALYTGATCLDCVTGYQDVNDDGECRPNCTTAATNGLNCGDNGNCVINTLSGVAECDCTGNFAGADCSACASGFHLAAGACEPDEVCGSSTGPCVNGSCEVVGGLIQCICAPGYARDADGYCTLCASGYHLDSGNCVIDEVCVDGVSCSGRGTCAVIDGITTCTSCDDNFSSVSDCALCITGWHESGGVCVFNEVCLSNSCSSHGACDDSSGVVVCSCTNGWTGDACEMCPTDYHEVGGSCVLNETCLASSCSYHGTCDDSSGVVTCTCDDPLAYAQPYCATCNTDYHRDGATGDCLPDETCIAGDPSPSCNLQGSCDDSDGVIVCDCDVEWTGDTCSSCAIGFHLDSGDCVADPTCATAEPTDMDVSCNGRGTCDDSGGSVVCACSTGWDDSSHCTVCATGYHDEDGACVINEVCDAGNPSPSCSSQGSCDDSSGVIVCSCNTGYWGDICDGCDTDSGYYACDTVCCSAGDVCVSGSCVTPLTCDDIDPAAATECGPTLVSDGAGGLVDCGDCGDNGTCVDGTCACDANYGVLDGEHVCKYACDGYLPEEGCCDGDFVVYCDIGGSLRDTYCGYYAAPDNTCGWSDTRNYFDCVAGTPPGGVSAVCPANIVVDKTIPECTDDMYEGNDVLADATELIPPLTISATKCGGNVDLYSVYLSQDEIINITLNFVHSAVDLDMRFWYESLTVGTWETLVTYQYNSSASSSYETFSFQAGSEYPYWPGSFTGEGYYIIEVLEGAGNSGGYQLDISID